MPWNWRYETATEGPVQAGLPEETFTTQADAETWLGEHWRDLLDAGVDQVTLYEDEHVVYGPMSLHPAQ
jgi:IS5 family transposase